MGAAEPKPDVAVHVPQNFINHFHEMVEKTLANDAAARPGASLLYRPLTSGNTL